MQVDRHLDRLLRRQIEAVNESAVLENDRRVAQRGELDVIFVEVRKLARGLRFRVQDEEVHPLVGGAVGEEVDPVAVPHRIHVLGRVIGEVRGGLVGEIVEPDLVGHAAAVPLPGAELAEDAVIGQLLAVGRVGAPAATRQRKLLGHAAVDRNGVELAQEVVERRTARAEDNRLVVARGHHDIVRTHAVGNVVPFERRRVSQPLRHAARGRHQVDLRIAVVLAGEGDPLAIGRKAGKHLEARIARQPPGHSALRGNAIQIARVGENDLLSMDRRKSQQAGLVVGSPHARTTERQHRHGGTNPKLTTTYTTVHGRIPLLQLLDRVAVGARPDRRFLPQ